MVEFDEIETMSELISLSIRGTFVQQQSRGVADPSSSANDLGLEIVAACGIARTHTFDVSHSVPWRPLR